MALVERWRRIRGRVAAGGWRAALVRAALLAAGWMILVGGDRGALGFGVPVVLAALAASLSLPAPAPPRWRPLGLLWFALAFAGGSVRAGIDVAARALAPRVRIAPAIVAYTLRLPEGPARNLFVATVSLMPGTLSVDVDGRQLHVHALVGHDPTLVHKLEVLERRVARALGERLGGADA